MRKLLLLPLILSALFAQAAPAQNAQPQSQPAPGPLTGRWIMQTDLYGTSVYLRLHLDQQGDKLTGDLDGDKLEGSVAGNVIHFLSKDNDGGTGEAKGTLSGTTIGGTIIFTDPANAAHPGTHQFTATLVQQHAATKAPQRHEFTPTVFYRQFSPASKPVLTISPGDAVHTSTVDAGGADEKSVTRVLGGNPETGPFYIETAAPGDTLVVHLTRLRLNRDWAGSDDYMVGRALDNDLAVKMKDAGKSIRWHLDLANGTASPEKPAEHLAHYTVPLRPMLGCIAAAPGPAQAPPGTGDSGRFGGNMDFDEIIEGATIYLPVSVPGAFLYVGDGHAAQGDGELNGNALETSMDVEFTVDVIPAKNISGPRVESATHIMAVGLSGSIDDSFRQATSNMAQWLTDDYKLTPSEVAQVLGTSAEYKISEAADRNAGVVLKLNKSRLQPLLPK